MRAPCVQPPPYPTPPFPPHPPTPHPHLPSSNTKLSEQYLSLARDLDVMEAKTPEDVYKMHLVEGRAPTGERLYDSVCACTARGRVQHSMHLLEGRAPSVGGRLTAAPTSLRLPVPTA